MKHELRIMNNGSIRKYRRAFTLIEVLTVLFLSVVIIAAAYAIYLISAKSFKRNFQNANLSQNARVALERMSRDIRQGIDLVTVLPIDPDHGTPATELKFQDGHNFSPGPLPSNPTPSPSPSAGEVSGRIQYITYYLNGTDLYRKVSHYSFGIDPDTWVAYSALDHNGHSPTEHTDENVAKANNIAELEFWGANNITIHLQVANGTNAYDFETQALMRNK